jgi:hypothetical protein
MRKVKKGSFLVGRSLGGAKSHQKFQALSMASSAQVSHVMLLPDITDGYVRSPHIPHCIDFSDTQGLALCNKLYLYVGHALSRRWQGTPVLGSDDIVLHLRVTGSDIGRIYRCGHLV